YADCCDLKEVRKAVDGCQVAYHLAAAPHEGLSVFSPTVVTRNTYLSSVAVFTAACDARVKRVGFTSSMARYRRQHFPVHETQPPAPVDPYGIAKVASEKTMQVLCETHGVEYVNIVPHNIYGPRQKYDDPYRNVVAIMMNRLLQRKQPIIYGDGKQRRC